MDATFASTAPSVSDAADAGGQQLALARRRLDHEHAQRVRRNRDNVRAAPRAAVPLVPAAPKGADLLDRLFSARVNLPGVFDAIERVIDDVDAVRDADYFGQCLWREDVRSTTYFSKWIEAKETGATN